MDQRVYVQPYSARGRGIIRCLVFPSEQDESLAAEYAHSFLDACIDVAQSNLNFTTVMAGKGAVRRDFAYAPTRDVDRARRAHAYRKMAIYNGIAKRLGLQKPFPKDIPHDHRPGGSAIAKKAADLLSADLPRNSRTLTGVTRKTFGDLAAWQVTSGKPSKFSEATGPRQAEIGDWVVRDRDGRLSVYRDKLFHRKFKADLTGEENAAPEIKEDE